MVGVGEILAIASLVSGLKGSYDTVTFLKMLFSRDKEIHYLLVRYETARILMKQLLEAADRKIAAQGDSNLQRLDPDIKRVLSNHLVGFNNCDLELKKRFEMEQLEQPAFGEIPWGNLTSNSLSKEDRKKLKSLVPKRDKLFKLFHKSTVVSNLDQMEYFYERLKDSMCGILSIKSADIFLGGIEESDGIKDEEELEAIAGAPDTFGQVAANVAQLRLANIDPSKFQPVPKLDASDLKLEIDDARPVRSTAEYNGQQVLIEWKYIDPGLDDSSRAAITIRVQELGKLLYQAKGKEFKVPQCVAIYTASQFQLGYVFSTPSTSPGELRWYTLGDRLRPLQTNKGKQTPILGDRFRLAYTLAKAFYLLHCAAWLHKDFRSDNVLFFDQAGSQPGSDTIAVDQMYISGFQYSRPDTPGEPSIETHANTDDVDLTIYRHPQVGTASKYTKKFDLYSLGVVLFEIALWEPLAPRYRKVMHKRDRKDWLLEAADVLGARVGAVYRDVVKVCLEQDSLDDMSKTKDLNSVLLEDVVEALERCMA